MGAGHEVAGKRPTKEPPRRVRYDRVPRTTRTIEQGANRPWCQKVGQMSRVFQVQTTGRFEVEDFAIHIQTLGWAKLSCPSASGRPFWRSALFPAERVP